MLCAKSYSKTVPPEEESGQSLQQRLKDFLLE